MLSSFDDDDSFVYDGCLCVLDFILLPIGLGRRFTADLSGQVGLFARGMDYKHMHKLRCIVLESSRGMSLWVKIHILVR